MINQRNETSLFCVDTKKSQDETPVYPDVQGLGITIVIEKPTKLMLTCKM